MMFRRSPQWVLEASNVLRALFVFIGCAGMGLAGMLVLSHVPLSSTDPLVGNLTRLWWLSAFQVTVAVLGWSLLWGSGSHPLSQEHTHWAWSLGAAIVTLGLLAGHFEFELRYAQVQSRWSHQLAVAFQQTITNMGLDTSVSPRPTAESKTCSQARDEVHRAISRWANPQGGGAVAPLMAQSALFRGLRDRGCLSPQAYARYQGALKIQARHVLTQIAYERYLPVWGWPLRTWWSVHRAMLDDLLGAPSCATSAEASTHDLSCHN